MNTSGAAHVVVKRKVTVCGHRVLLKPHFDHEEIQDGALKGFQLDVGETFKREKAATVVGEVVSIGPTAWKAFDGDSPEWKPWAKIGDIVYFAKYGGKFIKVNDEDYIIVNDEDIQGVIEEDYIIVNDEDIQGVIEDE